VTQLSSGAAPCAAAGEVAVRCSGRSLRFRPSPPHAAAGAPLRLALPHGAVVAAEGDCAALVGYAPDVSGDRPPPPTRAVLLTRHAHVAAEVATLARDDALPAATADALVRLVAAALQPRPRRAAALAAAHLALHRGWPALLRQALAALAAPDESDDWGEADDPAAALLAVGGGMTLLHRAAAIGDARACRAVLAAGGPGLVLGSPASQGSAALAGRTPLHLAALHADGAAAAALCDSSPAAAAAWFAARDAGGVTPAQRAQLLGSERLHLLSARLQAQEMAAAHAERAYCTWLAEQNLPVVRSIAGTMVFHSLALLFHTTRRILLLSAHPVLPPVLASFAASSPLHHPLGSAGGPPLLVGDVPWEQVRSVGMVVFATALFARLPSCLFLLWAVCSRSGVALWRRAHERIFVACTVLDMMHSVVIEIAIYFVAGRVLFYPFALNLINIAALPVVTRLGPCRPRWNLVCWLVKLINIPGLALLHPRLWPMLLRDPGAVGHVCSVLLCMLMARATDRRMRATHAATLAVAAKKVI